MGNLTWHVYDGVAGAENYVLVVVGPAAPGEKRASDGEPWESPLITSINFEPMILNHRAEFDHEPTEAEQLELVPEEYRKQFAEWQANQAAEEEPQEDFDTFELDEEEKVALGLALSSRIEQLHMVRDRTIVMKGGIRMIEACDGQISALTRIYNRLELSNKLWNF